MLAVNQLAGFGAGGGFRADVVINGTTTNFDLGAHLQAYHAWDGAEPAEVTLTITGGSLMNASSTASSACTIALPAGSRVTLINHGSIIGRGGNGGAGGPGQSGNTQGNPGGAGGTAISVNCPITIDNHGLIAGGGGGGGGGDGDHDTWYAGEEWYSVSAGGGGGGGGAGSSAGGAGGSGNAPGSAGAGGNQTTAGSGGAGGADTDSWYQRTATGGNGGAGGTLGAGGAAGGAAGKYLVGAANVTWITVGDVRGPSA